MKLNRNHVFIIGVGIIILYIFINRYYFIFRSNFVKGEVVSIDNWSPQEKYAGPNSVPVVQFLVNNHKVIFKGEAGLGYKTGDTLDVIYLKSRITNAYIYSLKGFWIPGALWVGLFPLMLLIAAVYSFIESTDTVFVDFNYILRIKRGKKNKNMIKLDS